MCKKPQERGDPYLPQDRQMGEQSYRISVARSAPNINQTLKIAFYMIKMCHTRYSWIFPYIDRAELQMDASLFPYFI